MPTKRPLKSPFFHCRRRQCSSHAFLLNHSRHFASMSSRTCPEMLPVPRQHGHQKFLLICMPSRLSKSLAFPLPYGFRKALDYLLPYGFRKALAYLLPYGFRKALDYLLPYGSSKPLPISCRTVSEKLLPISCTRFV